MRSDVYDNPADDPEAQKFLPTIAQAGKDQLPRMEFADWLDENGYSNAAKGMRWASKHGKHIAVPMPLRQQTSHNANPYLSGYYLGLPTAHQDTEYAKETRPHRLPQVFRDAIAGDGTTPVHLAKAVNVADYTPEELAKIQTEHEQAFVRAAHHVNYNDEGDPLSQYPKNSLGYQSDLVH